MREVHDGAVIRTGASEPTTAWHALTAEEAAGRLGTDPHGGLTGAAAEERAAIHGPNALEAEPERGVLDLLLAQFTSPLIAILIVAGLVTIALGKYTDAVVITVVLLANATIGFVQERRADRSMHALMELSSPTAMVVRDGRPTRIDASRLVPGDVVLLESGARVPADLRLVATTSLRVDESLLTGESLPVDKSAAPVPEPTSAADRRSIAHAGTTVASGRGRGLVVAIGTSTELGRIAERIRVTERPQTPLQARMGRFANIVTLAVLATVVVSFALGLWRGADPSDMFLTAVALAVAVIPEGLPIAFTVALALGVRRMAERNALVRSLPAVETLGSTDVIGSDKTGTLTANRMTVVEAWTSDGTIVLAPGRESRPGSSGTLYDPSHALASSLKSAVLANEADLVHLDGRVEHRGDPTETALLEVAERVGLRVDPIRSSTPVLAVLPFEPALQYSAVVVDEDGPVLRMKGAPERVVAACTTLATVGGQDAIDPSAVLDAAARMAERGLRVLATAERRLSTDHDVRRVPEPEAMLLTGLIGMQDPPRPGVKEAIAACQHAGIRVLMITGDHVATARSIARELGIDGTEGEIAALTGADLAGLDEQELRRLVHEVAVFARVAPDEKLAIVQALQHGGAVVAVTGDGVNDAPSLKAADIGVAMGASGTDVAREASDMVLTDDAFVSIAAAVEEGRVVFENVRKVVYFLLSTGVATILAILVSLLAGWPLPYAPAALLWLNVVTNGLDDVGLAFDPGEPDVLDRPPRRRQEGIVSAMLWRRATAIGIVMGVGSLWLFRWGEQVGLTLEQQRGAALTTLVFAMGVHTLNARSERRLLFTVDPRTNPLLMAAIVIPTIVHVLALGWGPTQRLLRVDAFPPAGWGRIALVCAAVVVLSDGHKLWRRRVERRAAEAAGTDPGPRSPRAGHDDQPAVS